MKVFISWSGDLSHKVALVFREWLPSVIQSIEPYVSSVDIDKGARWSTDIAKELESSDFGILCITRENLETPWLNFEAGALSKSIDKSRVSPFLFAIKRSEIKDGPILQFQSTIAEKEDVKKLLLSINSAMTQGALEVERLNTVFEVWWKHLEDKLNDIEKLSLPEVSTKPKGEKHVHSSEILEELLELMRQQNRLLNDPSMLLPPSYVTHVLSKGSARGRDFDHFSNNHPVFEDLQACWNAFEEKLRCVNDDKREELQDLLAAARRLEGPIRYILRGSRKGRPRLLVNQCDDDNLDFGARG